jgi:hypothetical protein
MCHSFLLRLEVQRDSGSQRVAVAVHLCLHLDAERCAVSRSRDVVVERHLGKREEVVRGTRLSKNIHFTSLIFFKLFIN